LGEADLKQLGRDLELLARSYLMKAFGLADLQWLRTRYPEELEGISQRFTRGVAIQITRHPSTSTPTVRPTTSSTGPPTP